MRRFATWMVVSFAAAQAAVAQQVPDADFRATVDKPAYVEQHPKVLFDEAHLNVHTASGTYQAFVGLMTSDGYLVTVNPKLFSPESLAGNDVLIISNARGEARRSEKPAFTQAECDAVSQWVRGGGGLLFVVDHYPTGHAAEMLAKALGVHLGKGRTADAANAAIGLQGGIIFDRAKNGIGDHAITRGRGPEEQINRVGTFTGESLKGPEGSVSLLILSDSAVDYFPSDAADDGTQGNRSNSQRRRNVPVGSEPQASAAGRSQGVAFTLGKGRVVVLGEASELSAQRAGPGQRPMGMNYPGIDNRQWAINIVHWLSRLID